MNLILIFATVAVIKWLWPSINKSSVKAAAILALLFVISEVTVIYMINPVLSLNIWYMLVLISLSILLSIWFGINYRNTETGGYLSFGMAFKFSLVVILGSELISLPFEMLHTVLDPEKTEILIEASYQNELEMERAWEEDPDYFTNEKLAEIRQQAADGYSPGVMIKNGIIYGGIGSAILALITAVFIKKKKPAMIDEKE